MSHLKGWNAGASSQRDTTVLALVADQAACRQAGCQTGTMWTEHEIRVNGVRLHYVEAGPAAGPLVVLLHGFPEYWRAWEHQIGPLARAGFRVVAPDMRGYNLSEKPQDIEAYRVQTLQEDIAKLIRALGAGRAHVVGHDWGGIVAWQLAIRQPEAVDRLVILNAPHPGAARRGMKHPEQLKRSWYVYLFQLPVLPELLLERFGRWALRGPGRTRSRRRTCGCTVQRGGSPGGARHGQLLPGPAALRHAPRPEPSAGQREGRLTHPGHLGSARRGPDPRDGRGTALGKGHASGPSAPGQSLGHA
ncbi:alpha/beta fold hydrolase [Deinococcus malanensis]|uniref:alpha/beta fold hydrolase n=1 Tax=Deinococcus malanensis TaxID=1706855 RepID=UPI003632071A